MLAITIALALTGAPDVSTGAYTLVPAVQAAKFYPKDALGKGQSGHVVVNCLLGEDMEFRDCRVISEDPVGQGFGKASLKALSLTHLKTVPGGPGAQSRVQIPFDWTAQ